MPLIGEGNYGCVFRPHVKCSNAKKKHPNAVGKVFIDETEFDNELRITEVVKAMDPDGRFTLPLLNSCRVGTFYKKDKAEKCGLLTKKSIDVNVPQLIYKDGGKSLKDMLKTKGSVAKFAQIVVGFKEVLYGMKKLIQSGYVHQDIKPHNLMFKNDKVYLIDFGIMTPMNKVYVNDNKYVLGYDYPYYPPEYKLYVYNRSVNTFYTKVMRNFNFNFEISGKHTDMIQAIESLGIDTKKELLDLFANKKGSRQVNKIDIYSLGFVLLEVYVWSGLHQKTFKNNTLTKRLKTSYESFIRGMIHLNVHERFDIDQALAEYMTVYEIAKCIVDKKCSKD